MAQNDPIHHLIDLDTWPRKKYFDHYYNRVKCTYSMTADLDIASLLILCKERSIKLYTAIIHIITMTNHISNIWTTYDQNFSVFNRDFLDDIDKYGKVHDFIAKGNAPGNLFPVSCTPFSFIMHSAMGIRPA